MTTDQKPKTTTADCPISASEIGRLLDDGLLVADANGVVSSANSVAVRFLGEGLVGKHVSDIFERDEPVGDDDQEFTFQPKSVVPRAFKVRVKKLSDGHIAVLLMDMTLQRNLEKVRRDFVANVSHELRSPLTSLAGFIETILSNDVEDRETQIRFLRIMDEEAKRMSRLIDDLLSLSRVEVDEHIYPTETVPVIGVMREVIDTLEERAARKGMQIALDDHRPDPASVALMFGHRDEINEVFHNLIENAIKYGYNDSIITVRVDASAQNSLIASVINKGDVIREKHINRLTERFYRVDKARSRQIGGTGLGLAIVKHIVNRHRGKLIITSETDGTNCFAVELPVISGMMQE